MHITSALGGAEWSASRPGRLTPGNVCMCVDGWMDGWMDGLK
jgi:hypothetical protein